MLLENQHPLNKAIAVSLLGKPNAGKSTLVNTLLGFDLSIVSHRPQTTRNQFHCAFTVDRSEIVLVDTPGLHKSNQELNKRMNGQAKFGVEGADLHMVLLDSTENPLEDYKEVMENLGVSLPRVWLVFTKSEFTKFSETDFEKMFLMLKEANPSIEKYFVISAKEEKNIHLLTGALADAAQPGPHLYPDGDVSNKNQRFFAAEYIREQAFEMLKEELPYELAVVIEEYKDEKRVEGNLEEWRSRISAAILVNRPSQRAIVVGSKGMMIKEIGTKARMKIEAMAGVPVHLNLHVKVSPKWFKNNFVLEEIGLPRVDDSVRVWRKK